MIVTSVTTQSNDGPQAEETGKKNLGNSQNKKTFLPQMSIISSKTYKLYDNITILILTVTPKWRLEHAKK